ncbi:MAG TPA: MarR family transcriptional regulator [Vicinamibacteria bacterium]|nr:MarR family transcriptional regulator [Vicinamibacteria bacterium]
MDEADSMEQKILVALRRIIRAVDQHSRALAQRFGLTGPQIVVLQELVRSGTLATGELAHRIHLAQGTVSEILERLEERGLVERRRSSEDKRRMDCSSTPAGAELLAQKPSLLQERFVSELERLSDWERSFLLSALQRVADMMHAEGVQAGALLTTGPATATAEQTVEFLTEKS